MGIRPRTKLVKQRKARRCKSCGSKLSPNTVRCSRCHTPQSVIHK